MIRILHSVSNMDRAGIETMLMNYYRHIDRSKVQFDFLVNRPQPGNYDAEIRDLGGNIYVSPGLNPIHYPRYLQFVKSVLQNDSDIKILHAHNEAMGLYALNGAKHAGLPTRIAHAHNTRMIKDYKYPLKRFCKSFLTTSATELWSCGREAGIYFFGAKAWQQRGMVMRNAIETEKFRFSETIRNEIRHKYHLENKTVIGHVGRFSEQKNHARLLDIFAAYAKNDAQAVLLLIGKGRLEAEMRQKAKQLQIEEQVLFVGLQENVNEWYMAMDVFVMPSLFEGLPVVGIEAQAAGLPCLFADSITDEVVLSQRAVRISLEQDNRAWGQEIQRLAAQTYDRKQGADVIRTAGYDIQTEAKRIETLYLKMSER